MDKGKMADLAPGRKVWIVEETPSGRLGVAGRARVRAVVGADRALVWFPDGELALRPVVAAAQSDPWGYVRAMNGKEAA
jgi:hypothetical protein